jgi:GntP family gluconate:H+ symporter
MNSELFTFSMAAGAIVVLIVLITKLKLNPFLALTLTAIGLGVLSGVSSAETVDSFAKGFGGALAKTGPVIGLGTLLGGILLGSGGADRIANAFIGKRPVQYAPWAICAAALLIGMPHLFDVSFIMLAPLVYTVAKRTNSHLLFIGLPLAAGLYVSHGLLPPHPAPTLAVAAFHANTGLTIFYGLLIAIPVAVICGPLFTKVISPWFGPAPDLTAGPVGAREVVEGQPQASLAASIIAVLLPPGLMLIGTLGLAYNPKGSALFGFFNALNNPILSLMAAVIFAFFALGLRAGFSLGQVQKMAGQGLAPLGAIVMILGCRWWLQRNAHHHASGRFDHPSRVRLGGQPVDPELGHRGAAADLPGFCNRRNGSSHRHRCAAGTGSPRTLTRVVGAGDRIGGRHALPRQRLWFLAL